jgi:hypothetical protein
MGHGILRPEQVEFFGTHSVLQAHISIMHHLYHEVGDKTVPTADGEPEQMLLVLLSRRKGIRKFIF